MIDMHAIETATDGKAFIRPGEISRITGISVSHVYDEIKNGNLPAVRHRQRSLLVGVDDFRAWLENNITPIDPTLDSILN